MRTPTSLIIVFLTILSMEKTYAQQSNGIITGEIDGKKIELQVRCEYTESLGLLNAKSDWEGLKQGDTDGDGFFITAGGMKSQGRLAVIFHHGERVYKFGHKGQFDRTGFVLKSELKRKDGSAYSADIMLDCS